MIKRIAAVLASLLLSLQAFAQTPDPNFFIYLCFGQSNMEAGARPAEQDLGFNDPRFSFMAAVDMPSLDRTKGNWYTAIPPICREGNNMGPVDFFGRKMIEKLPAQYRVGVINVSVAGAKLELWDKDACADYLAMEAADPSRSWLIDMAKAYGMNPYQRIVEVAKIAQKSGVIKGMLVHQGESNPDDDLWCGRLKKIHDDLCHDLGLNPDEIPILAGELKQAEEGGVCAAFNDVVLSHLPETMHNGYVISSLGCQSQGDQFHFNTEGMRLMGYRMADKMLELQGFAKPETRTITLKPKKLGIEVSPTLSGVFFEDLNQSLDGGISAQLIQNYSFQAYDIPQSKPYEFSYSDTTFFSWTVIRKDGAVGSARIVEDKPLVPNLKRYYDWNPDDEYDDEALYRQFSVRFDIENPGEGFGIAANGYGIGEYGKEPDTYYAVNTQVPSIPAVKDVSYDLSLYLQGDNYMGDISVYLEDAQGNRNSNVLTVKGLANGWTRFVAQLKAERSVDSRLAIVADAPGTFWLDFVTLLPEASQLWMDGKYGPFRKDLVQAMADLHPKFMRFPGGCTAEGDIYCSQVFWKNSVGPREERIQFRNHWGYLASQYVGFYEYMLLAESLGAEALPIFNNGITRQYGRANFVAPLDTQEDRDRFYSIYAQDPIDFIEFCNGGADTEWGALRAKMGHPEPFNLKYIGIGNENGGDPFWERFDIIYNAVKKAHPEITIISTAGPGEAGRMFDANMAQIDAKYPDTIVDEHYYKDDDWFYNNTDRYNPGKVRGSEGHTYDRKKPTRVFIGEFANANAQNAFSSALAEAAYWTGLERNSDMVVMAAYAPLFCKKGFNKWDSNLIWFDNRGMWRTCNYYYQKLFSQGGNRTFDMSAVMNGKKVDTTVYTSPTIDTATGTIFIKIVNSECVNKTFTVNTGSNTPYAASLEFISSNDTSVKNQGDQNYYSNNPEYAAPVMAAPAPEERPAMRNMAFRFGRQVRYTEAVVPHTKDLGSVRKSFQVLIPENSICVLKLTPANQ
ncbi:MAG: alpha-L-arabinofuranosidase [Bacteroidales bacterium]|nr:alpha-L-arabinofuranosidase [Bacteroidales bacterium]